MLCGLPNTGPGISARQEVAGRDFRIHEDGEVSRHLPTGDRAASIPPDPAAQAGPLSFNDEHFCRREQRPAKRGQRDAGLDRFDAGSGAARKPGVRDARDPQLRTGPPRHPPGMPVVTGRQLPGRAGTAATSIEPSTSSRPGSPLPNEKALQTLGRIVRAQRRTPSHRKKPQVHQPTAVRRKIPAYDPKADARTRTGDPFNTRENRGDSGHSRNARDAHEIPGNRSKSGCTFVMPSGRAKPIWWTLNGRRTRDATPASTISTTSRRSSACVPPGIWIVSSLPTVRAASPRPSGARMSMI
jgi:hypothetical protein